MKRIEQMEAGEVGADRHSSSHSDSKILHLDGRTRPKDVKAKVLRLIHRIDNTEDQLQNQLIIMLSPLLIWGATGVFTILAFWYLFSTPNAPAMYLVTWLITAVVYSVLSYRAKRTLKGY